MLDLEVVDTKKQVDEDVCKQLLQIGSIYSDGRGNHNHGDEENT